jgi:hypothetical protein
MFSSRKFAAKGKLTIYNVSSTSVWKVTNQQRENKEGESFYHVETNREKEQNLP